MRNQSCNALQYQQEQFVNAAQEHQRVACEQVEVAAAFATNRTAAQMTTRVRDIEKNVEANFRHQKRGLLSENTSESAQALEAQRHSSSRSYSRDVAEKHSQSRGGLPVKKVNFNFIIVMLKVNPMKSTISCRAGSTIRAIKYSLRTVKESM